MITDSILDQLKMFIKIDHNTILFLVKRSYYAGLAFGVTKNDKFSLENLMSEIKEELNGK